MRATVLPTARSPQNPPSIRLQEASNLPLFTHCIGRQRAVSASRGTSLFATFSPSEIVAPRVKKQQSSKRTQEWLSPKISDGGAPASSASRFANQDHNLAFAGAERSMGHRLSYSFSGCAPSARSRRIHSRT